MATLTTGTPRARTPTQPKQKPADSVEMSKTDELFAAPGSLANSNRPSSPTTPLSRVVTATDESIIFTNPSSVESTNTATTHTHSNEDNNLHQELDDADIQNLSIDGPNPVAKSSKDNETDMIDHDHEDNNENNDFYDANENKLMLQPPLQPTTLHPDTPQLQTSESAKSGIIQSHFKGTYIQDSGNDNVLLNNYTRKRRSTTRTSSMTTILDPLGQPSQQQGQPVQRSNTVRNSVLTQDSRGVDQATMEIERMRNSVLTQREQKKKKQRSLYDDDRVLVGNKVSEGHVNYVVAYNMLTGIRVAVSRCSGIMKPLTDDDFKLSKKLVFDVSGNELTPSSKYDFKFKDYSPTVFRELRMHFGLDPADYLVSLTSKYILSELNSPGKSGSFFYFSRDYRFIIKTIHPAEHRQLRRSLKDYYNHVKNNPNTMVSQFYGLHRVKMPLSYGKRRKIYFIVMNNLFPPHRDIHRTYDLKGSTMGRYSDPNKITHVVLKDLNWLQEKEIIQFGPLKEKVFLDQLKKDVQLLEKLKIMDYSFLIGFHDLTKDTDGEILKRKKLSVFSPISSTLHDLKNTNPTSLSHMNDLPTIEYHKGNIFYAEEGGITSTGNENEPLQYVYYLGIIDCLTHYSIIKRLETFWRSLSNDRATISAVPPKEYGERFLRFIQNSVNENTAGEVKKKDD